jgi:Raf kinase inhibitor-like YbhB/YbcL family protein
MDAPERPGGIGVQWLVYNIPADGLDMAEATPAVKGLASGGLQGRNDAGKVGYSAPCLPANVTYVYRFTVYAVDGRLSTGPAASSPDVMAAMDGHVLARGEITTTYLRPSWPWG